MESGAWRELEALARVYAQEAVPASGAGATSGGEDRPKRVLLRLLYGVASHEAEDDHMSSDPMHPTGKCKCAGEGECLWCRVLPLRRWLDYTDTTAAELARTLDITPETLSRYMNGGMFPSKVSRLAIDYVTRGAMKHDAWPEVGP